MNQVKGRLKMKSYMTNVMLSDIKSHYTEEENNILAKEKQFLNEP